MENVVPPSVVATPLSLLYAPKCERCGSKDVVWMLWGFPMSETFEMYAGYKKEHGEPPIWLGGCCRHSQLTLLPT
jgi:hypothetical protein